MPDRIAHEVREILAAQIGPTTADDAMEALAIAGITWPDPEDDLFVPPELDRIPHPPTGIVATGSHTRVPTRAPSPLRRTVIVVIAYDRKGFEHWRSVNGQGVDPRDLIQVFTNEPNGTDRLRGYQLTDDDLVVRWDRWAEGLYVNNAEAELSFARRNQSRPEGE